MGAHISESARKELQQSFFVSYQAETLVISIIDVTNYFCRFKQNIENVELGYNHCPLHGKEMANE